MRYAEIVESFDYPNTVDPNRRTKIKKILQIIDKNSAFVPFRDRIKIFGSVARGDQNAGDVDIMLDFSDQDHGKGFLYYPNIEGIGAFLNLCQKFYGLVDVFIKTKRYMAVRSDDARHWVPARKTKLIGAAAKLDGKSLDDVLAVWNNFD